MNNVTKRQLKEKEVVDLAMSIEGATFPNEVAYLYRLALLAPRQTQFVELGTYQGRTLTALSYAALEQRARVISIDNYSYEEPCSIETTRFNLEKVHLFSPEKDLQIDLIEGDSRCRPDYITEIGLLFVDSHHVRKHFDEEMRVWLDSVITEGIIACHDYNSPRWLEMTEAIDFWFKNNRYRYLGLERRLIAFQKLI